jgi:hypothetical protein
MTRRLLVVATAPDPSDELLARLSRDAGEDIEVAIVAPASDLPLVKWLANDDDRALEEARRRARELAEAEAGVASVVDARVGDPDPVTAVEDALQVFPADELVVVTRPKDAATWLEKRAIMGDLERFGLPVLHLVDDDVSEPEPKGIAAFAHGNDDLVGFIARHLVLTLAGVAGILIAVAFSLYFGLR